MNTFQRGDCLYDVFAGVGPFSILAAVQGKPTKNQPIPIKVYANDLNPESYKSLENNIKLNSLHGAGNIKCFNKGNMNIRHIGFYEESNFTTFFNWQTISKMLYFLA